MSKRRGVILYAHGARDPRWAEPFVRLRERVGAKSPDDVVELAFLEHLSPDLVTATARLAASGIDRIRLVPLFLRRGGHLRDDFPRQLCAARAAAPSVLFEVTPAAGESDAVLDALADFALQSSADTT
jgi:sirohydrochlorin cobaltochelatase